MTGQPFIKDLFVLKRKLRKWWRNLAHTHVPTMTWHVPGMPWHVIYHLFMENHDLSLTCPWQLSPFCLALSILNFCLLNPYTESSTLSPQVFYCLLDLGRNMCLYLYLCFYLNKYSYLYLYLYLYVCLCIQGRWWVDSWFSAAGVDLGPLRLQLSCTYYWATHTVLQPTRSLHCRTT